MPLTIRTLHDWQKSPREAIELQKRLGREIVEQPLPVDYPTRLIAGLDVSSTRFDSILTAGAIVWDSVTNEIVDRASVQAVGTYPYIPGLLSFREIPVLLQALAQLTVTPDLFFVDGQGRAHPRRMGIAAHLGLLLDRPTIGVGKSRLAGIFSEPGPNPGDRSALMDDEDQIGTVLRTKKRSNPLFISIGYKIDLKTAVDLVIDSLRGHKLPEPTRLAHLYVNAVRTGKET
ncbi:endonuclease V [Candidatus Peribacteria bacterium]|nr:MAG: endonuclease V [Candidatus Peribacteria bacterium]